MSSWTHQNLWIPIKSNQL